MLEMEYCTLFGQYHACWTGMLLTWNMNDINDYHYPKIFFFYLIKSDSFNLSNLIKIIEKDSWEKNTTNFHFFRKPWQVLATATCHRRVAIQDLCWRVDEESADQVPQLYPLYQGDCKCHNNDNTWTSWHRKSSHQDCLFSNLFMLTTEKISKLPTTDSLCGESTIDWWILHTKGQKSVLISWCHHVLWKYLIRWWDNTVHCGLVMSYTGREYWLTLVKVLA